MGADIVVVAIVGTTGRWIAGFILLQVNYVVPAKTGAIVVIFGGAAGRAAVVVVFTANNLLLGTEDIAVFKSAGHDILGAGHKVVAIIRTSLRRVTGFAPGQIYKAVATNSGAVVIESVAAVRAAIVVRDTFGDCHKVADGVA